MSRIYLDLLKVKGCGVGATWRVSLYENVVYSISAFVPDFRDSPEPEEIVRILYVSAVLHEYHCEHKILKGRAALE